MGTDRSIEFEGPCACGQGTFRIDDCEVDHSWPTSTPQWYEPRICCSKCAEQFSLQRRGKRFVLIRNEELLERENRKQAVRDYTSSILQSQEVSSALAQFESLLSSQKSIAAIYRLLRDAKLEHCAEATFRNHWKGPQAWIKNWATPKNMVLIFELLGMPTQQLNVMLSELNALEEYASQPPEVYGEPVYVLG